MSKYDSIPNEKAAEFMQVAALLNDDLLSLFDFAGHCENLDDLKVEIARVNSLRVEAITDATAREKRYDAIAGLYSMTGII